MATVKKRKEKKSVYEGQTSEEMLFPGLHPVVWDSAEQRNLLRSPRSLWQKPLFSGQQAMACVKSTSL